MQCLQISSSTCLEWVRHRCTSYLSGAKSSSIGSILWSLMWISCSFNKEEVGFDAGMQTEAKVCDGRPSMCSLQFADLVLSFIVIDKKGVSCLVLGIGISCHLHRHVYDRVFSCSQYSTQQLWPSPQYTSHISDVKVSTLLVLLGLFLPSLQILLVMLVCSSQQRLACCDNNTRSDSAVS